MASLASPLHEQLDLALRQGAQRLTMGYLDFVETARQAVEAKVWERFGFVDAKCVAPSTPILRSDYHWLPAEKISAGDTLLALSEWARPPQCLRSIESSVVEAVRERRAMAFRVVTSLGSVVSSSDHRWLVHGAPGSRWVETSRIRKGWRLYWIADPAKCQEEDSEYRVGYIAGLVDGDGSVRKYRRGSQSAGVVVAMTDLQALDRLQSYLGMEVGASGTRGADGRFLGKSGERVYIGARSGLAGLLPILQRALSSRSIAAGYLAGIFDSEGCLSLTGSGAELTISQGRSYVIEKVLAAATMLGIPLQLTSALKGTYGDVRTIRLKSQRKAVDIIEFFTVTRPAISRKTDLVGKRIRAAAQATVLSIEQVGPMDLVDLQTTSRTFVAGGLASHNCYWEERIGLKFRTVHRWLAIGDAVHRLPAPEQPELREALARLGSHKAGVLAPVLGRNGEDWRAWVELAEGATEGQLQGRVSEATGARPRGLTEPGDRFLRALLAAMPPERAGQVEAVFLALMKAGEMTNPVAAFLVMVDLAERDLADQGVEVKA